MEQDECARSDKKIIFHVSKRHQLIYSKTHFFLPFRFRVEYQVVVDSRQRKFLEINKSCQFISRVCTRIYAHTLTRNKGKAYGCGNEKRITEGEARQGNTRA